MSSGTAIASGGGHERVCVLYVDDDRANLMAFRAMAEDLYEVVTARSGEEALQLISSLPSVAVLVADQRMPGLSGVELCERVRVSHPDTVRMLVTAYSDLAAAIDAINRGHVSRYLRKPWNPDELLAALRESAEMFRLTLTVQQLQLRIGQTERMYALGVLVAGIGHELRNPLGWITTNLSYCRRSLSAVSARMGSGDPGNVDQLRESLREMEAALADATEGAQRVLEIVDGISLSSRNEAAVREPVDVAYVVRSILRLVQGEALHRGKLEVSLPAGERLLVLGSQGRLGQVLLNLVVNALQALRPEPGVGVVGVRLSRQGFQALIEVTDNGVGIPRDQQERIFDPFFTTKGKGTGLGLAISRQIIEEMGGTIQVRSEVGHGTTFSVSLPLAK